MSSRENEKTLLRNLIIKSTEGQISGEEIGELNHLLSQDAELQTYYVQCVQLQAALCEIRVVTEFDIKVSPFTDSRLWSELAAYEKTADELYIPRPESPKETIHTILRAQPPAKVSRFSLYAAVLSAAAMLFVVLLVHFAPQRGGGEIAILANGLNAKWENGNRSISEGDPISAGPLYLSQGFAELTLNGGARVILEAPAEITLENDSQLFLSRGRLTADIKNSVKNTFVVRTPNATVVDFGTEFGVGVDAFGNTKTVVYQGSVDLRQGSDPVKFEQSLRLASGQGGLVSTSGTLTQADAHNEHFMRSQQLKDEIRAVEGSAYHRWKTYNYALHNDPAVVVHFTFEKDLANADLLKNDSPLLSSRADGILGLAGGKPEWTQGRWADKAALQFDRAKDQQAVIPACKELSIGGPITAAAWVCIDDPRTGGHILSCRKGSEVNYQLAWFGSDHQFAGHRKRLQFYRYSQNPLAKSNLFSPIVDLKPAQWHLIAVTHDNREICFYVDGKRISTSPYAYHHQSTEADLIIGDVESGIQGYEKNRFNGLMDEIVILSRAMSPEEVARMYQAGMPQ